MTCTLCPRLCAAERTPARGDGYCRMPAGLRVARAALHQWEEPPISGTRGAGAVFFSGCTLRCCYCQNGRISAGGQGKDITPRRLREIFDELIAQGAHNIELVTATHFLPWILPALEPRLPVPVVYNCGGYERVETLRTLEGRVDIYLPDLKYADGDLAGALSGAPDYFPVACDAIREMFRQTGRPVYDENGIMQRGVIVRHLVLPVSGQHPPGAGLAVRNVCAGGRGGVADEPVHAARRHDRAAGAAGDGGGVPGGGIVYARLRHHRRLRAGAHLGGGGLYPGL